MRRRKLKVDDVPSALSVRENARESGNSVVSSPEFSTADQASAQGFRGNKGTYQRNSRLGAGGFGQVWAATVSAISPVNDWLVQSGPKLGDKVVVKWANVRDDYSPADNRAFLQDVNKAINDELSALKRLSDLSCVARVYDFGLIYLTLADGIPQGAIFLVEEYLEGLDFDKYLVKKFGQMDGDQKVFRGVLDPAEFFEHAFRLTYALRSFHLRGVIHGDIWQKNIKVAEDGELRFFDFGASATRYTPSLHADALAMKRSDRFIAPERRRGERHGRRSDIYSMGALFCYMCTGQDPLLPIPDPEELKNAVVAEITKHNPLLLAKNCGIADIVARCMRYEKDQRIRDSDALLNELRLFSFADLPSANGTDSAQDCVACLLGSGGNVPSLFSRMLRSDCARLQSRAKDMAHGIMELSGNHEDIVLGMSTYLSLLARGDVLLARTTPRYWSARNMGVRGRFLSMIRLVAQRGVRIRHIMLVCESDREQPETRRILEEHLTAVQPGPGSAKGAAEVCCKQVSIEQRREVIKDGRWETSYAILAGEVMAVQPVYDREDELRTVRFVHDHAATAQRRQSEMEQELDSLPTLGEWLRPFAQIPRGKPGEDVPGILETQ